MFESGIVYIQMLVVIVEMNNRNFIEHFSGTKKTLAFILICYLGILIPIWNSVNPDSNLSGFLIFTLILTLLISYVIYWQFAQYKRLTNEFKESGLLTFLMNNGFEIVEKTNGWNYELYISGSYNNSIINISLSSEKGNIWNKYFLNFDGISLSDYQRLNSEQEQPISTNFYPEVIRLTKNHDLLTDLKEHLDKFSSELNERNTLI